MIDCVIKSNCASKSNHPIQNPLLLVTEPRTRDNVFYVLNVQKLILLLINTLVQNMSRILISGIQGVV
jgi:hypothetical protein